MVAKQLRRNIPIVVLIGAARSKILDPPSQLSTIIEHNFTF